MDIVAILVKTIGVDRVLAFLLSTILFFAKEEIENVIASRADDPHLMYFLYQRIVNAEIQYPDLSGPGRLEKILTDQATKDYIKAIGIDIKNSTLATLISTYHQKIEPVLNDLAAYFLKNGSLPMPENIKTMVEEAKAAGK